MSEKTWANSPIHKMIRDAGVDDGSSLAGDTCARLVNLCQELIGYLEAVEESDSGRQFHPTTISSCRCMVADRLGEIIREMKSICENDKEQP